MRRMTTKTMIILLTNDLSDDVKDGVDDAADGVNDVIDGVDDAVDDVTGNDKN